MWIVLGGLFASQVARRLGLPPLIGTILMGILLGPVGLDAIGPDAMAAAPGLRTVAVTAILMRAGLGLDREKLAQQGSVALRLGVLPATCEAIVVATLAMLLFQFDFLTGLLLGCIVGAESPAVIVPGMLRLKSAGWGVAKGIPDAILTGSALSDVLLLLMFSLLLALLVQGELSEIALLGGVQLSPFVLLPVRLVIEVGLGLAFGYVAARLIVTMLVRWTWTQNAVQDVTIAACVALGLVAGARAWPHYSGYLAAMAMGLFLIELDAPLARRLRVGFNAIWVVAEIVLFVLLGASVQIDVLAVALGPGLLLLAGGLLLGRSLGWYLATAGSNWTWRERLFLLPGNSAKATVQAAIGAIPLAEGITGGDVILAIAALSILVTAPLGAWGIVAFAPKLLEKGEVDPAKVTVATTVKILAAVDMSDLAIPVLTKAAELARRSDGEAIVLYVEVEKHAAGLEQLRARSRRYLRDIRHQILVVEGAIPEAIVETAVDIGASEIVIGKRSRTGRDRLLLGSVSQAVLETSPIPTIVIEA
ncbi:MAG: cation:proton antiporter [Cyanobacteria bacterium P01_D01_bin.123]